MPAPSEIAMYLALKPIVSEFQSDPTSVACFDLRIVRKAIWIVEKFEGHFAGWMEQNPEDVKMVQGLMEAHAK